MPIAPKRPIETAAPPFLTLPDEILSLDDDIAGRNGNFQGADRDGDGREGASGGQMIAREAFVVRMRAIC
jgi:hypothetical protein